MSDSDRDDVTVSKDGVTVRKSLDSELYKSPLVTFTIRSEHDESIRFQLIDTIPAALSTDDIGFHPNYGAENWSIKDDSIVFERTFDPQEKYTTLFGVRGMEEKIHDMVETRPEINFITVGEMSNKAAQLNEVLSPENSQSIKEMITGDRNTLPGLEVEKQPEERDETSATTQAETEGDGTNDSISSADDKDAPTESSHPLVANDDASTDESGSPNEGATTDVAESSTTVDNDTTASDPARDGQELSIDQGLKSGPEPDTDDGRIDPEGADDPTEVTHEAQASDPPGSDSGGKWGTSNISVGGVAEALAEEFRGGNVSDEDRQLLREELSLGEKSTDARIQYLQNQMSDFAAYIDALEAFIDEGSASGEFLDEFSEEMNDFDERLADHQDQITTLRKNVEELRWEVGELDESLDDEDERTNEVEPLQEDLDDLESELAAVRTDVEKVTQFCDQLETTFGTLTGDEDADEDDNPQ